MLQSNDLIGNPTPILATGRGGQWACETSRLPHFLNNLLRDGGEIVSFKLRALLQGRFLLLCRRPSRPQGHSATGRIRSTGKPSDLQCQSQSEVWLQLRRTNMRTEGQIRPAHCALTIWCIPCDECRCAGSDGCVIMSRFLYSGYLMEVSLHCAVQVMGRFLGRRRATPTQSNFMLFPHMQKSIGSCTWYRFVTP
jgi:hypothetical protein